MKIPSNKILTGLGLIGIVATTWSTYWIGRRDELDQIINLGREVEYETNLRELRMFDEKRRPVSLFIRTEE